MHGNMTSPSSNAVWKTLDSYSDAGRANHLNIDKFSSRVPTPIDVASSHYFAPPAQRTSLKKQSKSPSNYRRQVSFNSSVDVRVSLADPPVHGNVWYTKDEIRSMRSTAMSKRSPLRHSDQMDSSKAFQLKQQILSSPPPEEDVSSANNLMSRVQSADAELHTTPAGSHSDPQDIRCQQLVSEMDREVFIMNQDRRNSTRRRLHNYCRVLDEIDRQVEEGYMMINVQELALVGKIATGGASVQALERGRRDATLAQAILMVGRRRL